MECFTVIYFFKIKKTWFQRNIDPLLYSGFWKIKNQKNQQNDKKCQQIHKKSTKSIKKSTKQQENQQYQYFVVHIE